MQQKQQQRIKIQDLHNATLVRYQQQNSVRMIVINSQIVYSYVPLLVFLIGLFLSLHRFISLCFASILRVKVLASR